jgi:outer membrane immunogenic protein
MILAFWGAIMRSILLSAVGLAALSVATTASAADLPRKTVAPIVAVPLITWTGAYIGINAGYTWGESSVNTTASPTFGNAGLGCGAILQCPTSAAASANSSLSPKVNGFIGGAHIGYNFQFNTLVVGLEADIMGIARESNGASVTNNSGPVAGFAANSYQTTTTLTKRLDYLGTVRARVGFLVTPSFLLYATGGLAYGQAKLNSTFTSTILGANALTNPFGGSFSTSSTRYGYVVGAGAEYKFTQNFSARVEYMYYDLGNVNAGFGYTQVNAANTPYLSVGGTSNTKFNGHIVRAGVSYHF